MDDLSTELELADEDEKIQYVHLRAVSVIPCANG